MSESGLIKIKQHNAAAIAADLELDEKAIALLENKPTSADFIQQLLEQELYTDAVHFLANALPRREATWWACLSARHTLTEKTPENEIKAIELAENWVYKPTEENRKPTLSAAQATKFKSAASLAALAAFWSGDNISPVAQIAIAPQEKLYARAVAGAVMLAATSGEPVKVKVNYRLFLKQGLNIASGGDGRNLQ
jgi:hypothetical protein